MIEKTKVVKYYNILLRVLIVVVTYGFIYKKVFLDKDLKALGDILQDQLRQPGSLLLLLLVIIMMLLNWGVESVKWRYLIRKIEKISFLKAYEAVFTGSSVSFFTPNRVGEYFGRVFILDKGSHVQGILITILGSISQLLITILTGTIALMLFRPGLFPWPDGYTGLLYYSILGTILFLDFMLLVFYFNIRLLAGFRRRMIRTRYWKYLRFLRIFRKYSSRELLNVILFSFIRYLIFSLQYYLLLRVFSVNIPLTDGLTIISLIFFVITIVPTVALTELGVRDTAALFLFGLYFGSALTDELTIGILTASTLLWMINLAVPAVVGTWFVYRLKFFRKEKNQE